MLEKRLGEQAQRLRAADLAAAKQAVARYDELLAAAEENLAAVSREAPHQKHATSLRVSHEPACP